METIRFAERRKVSKWPAIIVTCFLILGGCFVAYAINFEDNPKMLGFSGEVAVTESDGLEEVGLSDAEKLEQIMNLNYEIKDVSSADSTSANFISDIHVPTIYVDGKEVEEINTKIKEEYDQRFAALKEQMIKAEGKYSFNVTYTYFENIVGLKKIVSLVVKQQIIDRDSQKVTSEKMTVYNVDLSARTTVTQQEIALEIFGKDYKELLKQIDVIGCRNPTAKKNFEKKYWRTSKSFIAYSGVSEEFLQAGRVLQARGEQQVRGIFQT